LVNPLADYLYKKFCPDDRLSEEIALQPDTERVFLKVFQNIVKKENTLDNLKRAFVWHKDTKNFLEFVFRECGCVQWGEDAGNFVKDKMLEYCFGQDISSLSTENKGSLCVLYSSEPILLYLTEQFDPNHFDTFDYIDKWIRDFHDRGVRLDNEGSLTKWISDVKEYRNQKEYYEEMSEHFSAIIKSYKGLRDLVKTNIDKAKKSEDDIQKQLGFGNETEVFWHGGVYGNELRKKLEISAKIFRSTLRPRKDNFLYQGMIEYYELFAEEYDILKAEYTELNKDEGKFDSKLRRLDNIVKNLSPGVTLHKRFKFGKETYRTRIATLCRLLTSSENVWRVLGEGEQKKWIKCRAGFSFLKEADNLKFDLGGKVTWDIPDFQPLSKKTIALLHPGSKKKNESKKKIWIWSGIVAGVLVCAFLSIYSWKLSNNPSKAGASPAKPVPSEPTVNGQVNSVANVPKTSSGDLPETDSDFRNIEQHISEAEDKLKVRNYNDALNHCKSAKRALNDQPNAELKKKVEEIEERANSLKEQKQNSVPTEDVADDTNKPENKSDGSESHTSEEDKKSQEKDQDDPFKKE